MLVTKFTVLSLFTVCTWYQPPFGEMEMIHLLYIFIVFNITITTWIIKVHSCVFLRKKMKSCIFSVLYVISIMFCRYTPIAGANDYATVTMANMLIISGYGTHNEGRIAHTRCCISDHCWNHQTRMAATLAWSVEGIEWSLPTWSEY